MGDVAVLVDLATNNVFELNRTGRRVWEMLAEGAGRNAIRDRLEEEFTAESGQIENEVDALLTALRDEQLIEDDDSNGTV